MGIVWAVGSCILDPPTSLPIIPLQAPLVQTSSVVPPLDRIITNWPPSMPLQFEVPVQVLDPTTVVQSAAFLDYTTPNSTFYGVLPSMPGPDASFIQIVEFRLPQPNAASCHTITVFMSTDPVGLDTSQVTPASVQCNSLCTQITWFYDPTGTGGCPIYDAGGLHVVRDSGSDAPVNPGG